MLLPKAIRHIAEERGHIRGLSKLIARDYPKVYQSLCDAGLPMAEAIYQGLGNKSGHCTRCGAPSRFVNTVRGYADHCSLKCALSDPNVIAEKRARYMENWGVEHPMQRQEIVDKVEGTKIKNWGTTSLFALPEIKAKCRKTAQKRWGANCYMESVQYQLDKEEISTRAQMSREITMLGRYGVRSPLQLRSIFEKQQASARKHKHFEIKGHKFVAQGYEPQVIEWLVNEGKAKVTQIKTVAAEGMPTFWYKERNWRNDQNNSKLRAYFPDILLVGEHKSVLIEVKSEHTVGLKDSRRLGNVHKKLKAVWEEGHEIWLFLLIKPNTKARMMARVKNPGALSKVEFERALYTNLKAY